jgi:predicted outer membrane repeat protein
MDRSIPTMNRPLTPGLRRLSLTVLLVLTTIGALLAPARPAAAQGATITVFNGNDSGSGSLRDAITSAASDSTIVFHSSVTTVTLTSRELVIDRPLTIDGGGRVTIERSRAAGTPKFRVFRTVAFGNGITLAGLTIEGGRLEAQSRYGGAVENEGVLTIRDSTFRGNVAHRGGAIHNGGLSMLTVENSLFIGNAAQRGGGAIHNVSVAHIVGSRFEENSALLTGGGAIATNEQGRHDGFLTVVDSIFSRNSSLPAPGNPMPTVGGAIFVERAKNAERDSWLIQGTTFYDNVAGHGGAIFSLTAGTLINSTLEANLASEGGGITGEDFTIINSTISDNIGLTGAGGIQVGTAITLRTGHTAISNSVIAGNVNGDVAQSFGSLFTKGRNIVADGSLTGPNIINQDPLLGPLASNGGPTRNRLPLPGSPAIDAGDASLLPANATTDQRGQSRIIGTGLDLGATELSPNADHYRLSADPPSVPEGNPFTPSLVTLSVTRSGDTSQPDSIELLVEGTATPGIDFVLSTLGTRVGFDGTTISFPAGVDTAAVAVSILDDALVEADESIRFSLRHASDPHCGLARNPNQVEVTIVNDDLSTMQVTSPADSGPGSLRQLIADAEPGATIGFAPGLPTIVLTSGPLTIDKALTLDGAGQVVIERSRAAGAPAFRLIDIPGGAGPVTLDGLTLLNGLVTSHGGGAIRNDGALTIRASTLSGNVANHFSHGGAILNGGTLTVEASTLSANRAGGFGGAIYSSSSLTLRGSTLFANEAFIGGGAILNAGNLTLQNSTLSANRASSSAGAISHMRGALTLQQSTIFGNVAPRAGGIESSAPITLANSILASNVGGNYAGTAPTLLGANLVSDGTLSGVGVLNGDPRLGGLTDNGGPTPTHMPQAGSPVIDAGDNTALPAELTIDQRGEERVRGERVDLGAVEH